MTDGQLMLGLEDYAESAGISTRTLRRYLDAGEIPGATKVRGKWAIPATAVRQTQAGTVVKSTPPPAAEAVTVTSILATQPVMLDLETAARLLGITTYTLKANADYFQLVRFGHRGAYVMPKSRIRDLNGKD